MIVLITGFAIAVLVGCSQRRRRGRRDGPAAIVDWTIGWLPDQRSEWGDAMAAYLASIESRRARWRFALGCVRVALVAPVGPERPSTMARAAVVATAMAVVALGVAADRVATASPAVGQHGTAYNLVAAAVGLGAVCVYAALALRHLRSTSAGATARRYGLAGGSVIGAVTLAVNTPPAASLLGSRGSQLVTALGLIAILGTCVTAGWLAARAAGEPFTGLRAGLWCGMLGGAILAVGLLALTLGATRWFTHDSATIAMYHDSLSAAHYGSYHTHFKTVTGFVLSENVDTALLGGLVWVPALAIIFGTLGGALGRAGHTPATGAVPAPQT